MNLKFRLTLVLVYLFLAPQIIQAATIVYHKSYPGLIVKATEVQGPNITDLGGSIPASHDLQIKADDGDVIIQNLIFRQVKNMDFIHDDKQSAQGLHLGRLKDKSFYKTLLPSRSSETFSWQCNLQYRYKNRSYNYNFKVHSSDVDKNKPRFRKDDGTDELAISLGLGPAETNTDITGDNYAGLEAELKLSTTGSDTGTRFNSDMDIALSGIEQHVDRMHIIHDHKQLMNQQKGRLLALADATDKSMYQYARTHVAQDAETRRRAEAEARQQEQGGFQWGKLAAMATGAAIGGIGKLDTNSQMDVISSMVEDSSSGRDGVSSTRSTVDRMTTEMVNARAEKTGSKNDSGESTNATGDGRTQKSTTFKLVCESGVKNDIPIKYFSESCRSAKENFARVYGCNIASEMDAARSRCESDCGGPTCEEL